MFQVEMKKNWRFFCYCPKFCETFMLICNDNRYCTKNILQNSNLSNNKTV